MRCSNRGQGAAVTGTGVPIPITFPSESLNQAAFRSPISATPLTVFNPGRSYSSSFTPRALRSRSVASKSCTSRAIWVCVPDGFPLLWKSRNPVPRDSSYTTPPVRSTPDGVNPNFSEYQAFARSRSCAGSAAAARACIYSTSSTTTITFTSSSRRLSSAGEAARRFATIDDHRLPGDVRSLVRSEKGEKRGDLIGAGVPAERDLAVDLFEHGRGVFRFLHGREHIARTDGDHSHYGCQLEGHGSREFDDARLGGVVIRVERVPDNPVRRSHVDDYPTSGVDHPARRLLSDGEDSREVDGEQLRPLGRREIQKFVPPTDAGVVDQDVQSTQHTVDVVERPDDGTVVGDIGNDGLDQVGKPGLDLFGTSRITVDDDNTAFLVDESSHGRGADAARPTGDDHALSLQSAHQRM